MRNAPDPGMLEFHQGDRMKKALAYAGLSVEDMADYLGVNQATLYRWTTMRSPMKRQSLRLWALRTGVRLSWLETGQGPAVGPDPDNELPRLDSNQQPSGYASAQVIDLDAARRERAA
jgi:transcriptional regulator with XRE-family HTH domain